MKNFICFVFCFSYMLQAQSLLPYQVVSPEEETLLVKVYQTPKTKEWKAACLREESVLWKISNFPHNGERNFSYVSADGRIFLQLKNEFTKDEDIVLRSWRNGELLWEFMVKELSLPEETIVELPGKPKVWFELITPQKDAIEIQLNIPKKIKVSLLTGLPEKVPYLNRFSFQKGNDFLYAMAEGKKRSKEVSVESLLNSDAVTKAYKDAVAKNVPTGVMKDKIPVYQSDETLEMKELYKEKINILHPDTLSLYILRFCRSMFTPEEMATILSFRNIMNIEEDYYFVIIHPKLPYSAKLQKLVNPKFRDGVDPERVCNYLKISRDGQIFGCFSQKTK